MSWRYDLIVIGGGTAGLVSAGIAAGTGARVALIERDRTGGDCLWTGCVPSKSLIAAASLAHRMRHADAVGLDPVAPRVDLGAVMDRVRDAITTIEPQDSPERLRARGVEVLTASARFTEPGVIEADGRALRYRTAVIATGSRPASPSIPGLSEAQPLTTDTIWDLRELPQRLVVLGGGPVGCELGQAFARLGSQVTIVEVADRLLAGEDPDAGELIAGRLAEDGVSLRLGHRAAGVTPRVDGGGELLLEGTASSLSFDRILIATGRHPATAALGLDTVGVQLEDRGGIRVDEHLATTGRGIYAAGDVTGLMAFTHVAAHHARVATPNALFHTRARVSDTLPRVTFTEPEVAHVGVSEAQARARWGMKARVTRYDYSELDRAITAGVPYGFAKLIGDRRGRLVGATVAAPAAGEAIAELVAWVSQGKKIDTVSQTVHAYPTLAEGPARAADDYLLARYRRPVIHSATRLALAGLRAFDAVK